MKVARFYLAALFLGVALLAAIRWVAIPLGWEIPSAYLAITGTNIFVTGLVYRLTLQQPDPVSFTRIYLGGMVLKMLANLGLMILVGISDPLGQYVNAVFLMVCYVSYTVLEIYFLYPKQKKKSGD